ncbi:MAG: UPF0280 family protein [Synergistota bacterium]|nr:UPF0280 family protein [Synergistota bacterium]
MNNLKKYHVIGEGVVLVDYGPVTMTLEARKMGTPFTEAAMAGADKAIEVFNDLAVFLEIIRKPVCEIGDIPVHAPEAVKRMVNSVRMLNEPEFTPLAAVAGTVSDLAVEEISKYGSDFAMTNNGGDIAWRVTEAGRESIKAALISDIKFGNMTHSLEVKSLREIRGIATSGMGGRSLTRGIASAVTVLAENSSMADAAATSIANACICDDPAIIQCLAEELDYGTDIKGLLVTKSVGNLKEESVSAAILSGKNRIEDLINCGMIQGAVIFVSGEMAVVRGSDPQKCLFEVKKIDQK